MNAPEQKAAVLQDVGEIDRRDIPGYEGLYSVTRDGRVWALPKTWRTGKDGNITHSHNGRWLTQIKNNAGYPYAELTAGNGGKKIPVHRLVALTWIPNPLGLPQVNHINGVKEDARDVNLEWCTQSQNIKHAHDTGLVIKDAEYCAKLRTNSLCSSAKTRKLTMFQANDIRQRHARGETQTALANEYGLHQSGIWKIVNGVAYAE